MHGCTCNMGHAVPDRGFGTPTLRFSVKTLTFSVPETQLKYYTGSDRKKQ